MKVCCISDLHQKFPQLIPGDLLICTGDVCNYGVNSEICYFIEWFNSQKYEKKIFIPGNHDRMFDVEGKKERNGIDVIIDKIDGVVFSNGFFSIDGYLFMASSYCNPYEGWAFDRSQYYRKNYYKRMSDELIGIDRKLDFLLTHSPAYGVLDRTFSGNNIGCEFMADFVKEVKPKYHIFGHCHESYGVKYNYDNGSYSVNCALAGRNEPVYFDTDGGGYDGYFA